MALRLADGRGMGGNPGAHRVPVDDQPEGRDDVDGQVDDNVDDQVDDNVDGHVDDNVDGLVDDNADDQPGGKDKVDDQGCVHNCSLRVKY